MCPASACLCLFLFLFFGRGEEGRNGMRKIGEGQSTRRRSGRDVYAGGRVGFAGGLAGTVKRIKARLVVCL